MYLLVSPGPGKGSVQSVLPKDNPIKNSVDPVRPESGAYGSQLLHFTTKSSLTEQELCKAVHIRPKGLISDMC